MPAIWSSSERPISVRTVWVDGIRHAILSPDDPLINSESRRCSRVSRNKSYTTDYQQLESRLDRLDTCFTNLQMVVGNNPSETKTSPKVYRNLSAPPCPRMYSGTSDARTVSSVLGNNVKVHRKHQGDRASKEETNFFLDKRAVKSDICERRTRKSELDVKLSITECKQAEGTSDTFWDPLFERVVQWLDLSGRARSYDFEDDFDKARLPRLKRDSFEGKERVTEEKYKLQKDSVPECFKRDGSKMLQPRLPKIKNTREQLEESDETSVVSLPHKLDDPKTPSQLDEEETKNEVKEKASSAIWSPPGRLKLHVVIPNLVCTDNHMSSQESLMDD